MINHILRFLFASLLATTVGAFMTVAQAEPLQVVLEAGDSNSTIRVNLTNSGSVPLSILRWDTPFESTLSSNVFRIKRLTKNWPLLETAEYVGREIKRASPESSHFLLLQPGATVSTEVVLNEHYQIQATGSHAVKFTGDFHYTDATAPSDFDLRARKVGFLNDLALAKIQSAGVMIDLYPRQLDALSPTVRILPPIYENCSVGQQTAIQAAAVVAEQMVNTATADLSGLADDEKASSPRYNTWFGAYTDTRFDQVLSQYQDIGQALAQAKIRFDCRCEEAGVFAYVYPSRPYNIFLCPAFVAANIDGTDSRAGTIIHELSHFTILGGTDDHAYGQLGAQALASSDPNRAIGNADSMEYFAENTPTLPIRSDGSQSNPQLFIQLTLGSPISGELAQGESLTYEVIDAGNIALDTLSGDADLTIYGDEALSAEICSSSNRSASDVCEIFQNGRIFVQVFGFSASTFRLEATGDSINPELEIDAINLSLNSPVLGSLLEGGRAVYEIDGANLIELESLSGDADLYVFNSSVFESSNLICASVLAPSESTTDSCNVPSDVGRVYLLTIGFTASEFSLVASVVTDTSPETTISEQGQLSPDQAVERTILLGEYHTYTVTGVQSIQLNSDSGDADLLVSLVASLDPQDAFCTSERYSAVSTLDDCDTLANTEYHVVVFGFTEASYTLLGVSSVVAIPRDDDPINEPVTAEGYVFARTDKSEFRWVSGANNIWINSVCAASLGGATQSGTWSDLNDVAPGFDQASDPCNGASSGNGGVDVPGDGFVFARDDKDEFRWVSGTNNIWISSGCAASLGGATQTGTWSDLNAIAPGFDQAADPCNGTTPPPVVDGGTPPVAADGYVFARTDKSEFRWVIGTNNIWINSDCAASLGGATQSGTWSDLNDVAPGFDQASDPCNGASPGNDDVDEPADGYVFARDDKDEFRWVVGSNNIWIPESCAVTLGGASLAGSWSDLNAIAPGFDQAENPCL
jgi:peptidyl-Lys metalloendopeptidase